MAVFVTGATGFLGGYAVSRLLSQHDAQLTLLVRAQSREQAQRRVWESLQLHMPFARFRQLLHERVELVCGDLTAPRFGLDERTYRTLLESTDSVLHIAAALNRMSARLCFDVNLRGTLEVVELVRAAHAHHGLRRFSFVSTTAVAGERKDELVREDAAIDWRRRDYDPYARTKKFCEHLIARTLPEVPQLVLRPAIVMGDSRFAATTQFDMVRATAMLARMRVLPLDPAGRQDIVPADFVGHAIADLHQKPSLSHRIYHLSAGASSETNAQIMRQLRLSGRPVPHAFAPWLGPGFGASARAAAGSPRGLGLSYAGALMASFWPYVTFNTVFDNRRVVDELGVSPVPFGRYASALLDYAIEHDFRYSLEPWPERGEREAEPGARGRESREVTPSPA